MARDARTALIKEPAEELWINCSWIWRDQLDKGRSKEGVRGVPMAVEMMLKLILIRFRSRQTMPDASSSTIY